ncbi:MAG: hypothetical protein AAGG51_04410 [Cyanobacteria bacterium P01_G01_bin.54]
MSLQPIHLPDYPEVRIIGDVQIDPTVAIAPGVILQAAPGSSIRLAAGVCLGMGVIIKAYGGVVQLDAGVSLGPGVLIMGPSHLGSNACIGGISTLWHTTVEPMAVIPAGTVMGDPSRQVDLDAIALETPRRNGQTATPAAEPISQPVSQPRVSPLADPWEPAQPIDASANAPTHTKKAKAIPYPQNMTAKKTESDNAPFDNSELETIESENAVFPEANSPLVAPIPEPPPVKPPGQATYGKVMLNQLLITLFPHEQSVRRSPPDH